MKHLKAKYYWIGGCAAVVIALLAWGATYISRLRSYSDEEIQNIFAKGIEAVEKNDVVGAFPHLQTVIDATSNGKDDDTHFDATVYMAMIFLDMGQIDEAHALLKKLSYRETNRPELYGSQYYLRLMGYIALNNGDVKAAKDYINRSLELERRLYPNDTAFTYLDLSNLCEIYYLDRDHVNALKLVRQLQSLRNVQQPQFLTQTYYIHACLMLDQAKPDSALFYVRQGLNIAQKLGNATSIESQLLGVACRADSMSGDIYRYIADRHALDSINAKIKGGEVSRQIAVIREQNKMTLIQRENELDNFINMIVMGFMIMVIIMLTLLLYSLRKRALDRQRLAILEKKKLNSAIDKERLENELLQLKQERTASELEKEKTEKLSMSIKLVEHGDGHNMKYSLQALDAALNAQHADFIRRISRAFPRISDNDIRLLGFIRMGIAPAVIAKALNVTMSSMNTARYRLRKKLGLDSSIDLNSFAQNF